MHKLSIQRNEANYTGLFAEPPFTLWGEGAKILEGLYRAFRPFGITLADIRSDHGSGSLADEGVSVHVGSQASFRFKLDRIEASINSFTTADLESFADLLSFGEQWLRGAVPGLNFSSHLFSYVCHGAIDGTTSSAFLSQLASPQIHAFGQCRGNGIIWHGDIERQRVQLALDHSILVPEGLFLQFILVTLDDVVDYAQILRTARERLSLGLGEIGLEPVSESRE